MKKNIYEIITALTSSGTVNEKKVAKPNPVKKNHFALGLSTVTVLIFVIFFLTKCADEKVIEPVPIPEKDYAELTIQFGKTPTKAGDIRTNNTKNSPSTKADDEEIPATDDEKKIESLACFVQTFDEGIIGQEGYKPGTFLKFFTHEAKGTTNGFTDYDFDNTPPTVKLKIQSQGFKGETQLVFIANYEENGLKDALLNIKRMEDLAVVRTPDVTTQGIKYPLLMTGTLGVALSNNSVVTGQEVTLTRIMARIDIKNNANTGEKPFVLQSAEVISPKLYSYLMEGNDDSYNIPVLDGGFTAAQAGSSDVIEGLYTYETANDGTVEHTAILIRGTLNGESYAKRIDMQTAGLPVPLGRNKRYLVILNKTGSSQEITFTFKVDDWEDGSTFPVQPEHDKPVLDELEFSNGFDRSYWNEVEALYNMENQPTGRITFTVTGRQQIAARVSETKSYAEGSTSNIESLVNIQVSDPAFNGDGTITQRVTLDFATANILRNKEPVDISIQVYNILKPSYNETIHITNLLPYPGTNFKPVWLGGRYWSPVNVGATTIRHDGVMDLSTMGYVYQWGRNTNATVLIMTSGATYGDEIQGPKTYAQATTTFKNNYIKTSTSDWLDVTDIAGIAARDALWSNPATTPCPTGWRMPASTDLEEISKAYKGENVDLTYSRVIFPGDDGQYLYLPIAGWRSFSTGASSDIRIRSLLWATDLPDSPSLAGRAYNLEFSSADYRGCFVTTFHKGYAFHIRCVRIN